MEENRYIERRRRYLLRTQQLTKDLFEIDSVVQQLLETEEAHITGPT